MYLEFEFTILRCTACYFQEVQGTYGLQSVCMYFTKKSILEPSLPDHLASRPVGTALYYQSREVIILQCQSAELPCDGSGSRPVRLLPLTFFTLYLFELKSVAFHWLLPSGGFLTSGRAAGN